MSQSKKDRVNDIIRRHLSDAIDRQCREADLKISGQQRGWLMSELTCRMLHTGYNWLELCDVFDWKKRKVPE